MANGAAGLSGGLLAQRLGVYDISLGSDAIIIGLAGVILGEALLRSQHIHWALIGLVLGSLIYQLARTAVLSQHWWMCSRRDLQVATALLIVGGAGACRWCAGGCASGAPADAAGADAMSTPRRPCPARPRPAGARRPR